MVDDWSMSRELRGHTSDLIDAGFTADGRYIVTSSFDYTAKIWEAASGRALLALQGHPGTVYSATMTPDHRHVLTLSEFGGARVHACEVCCSTEELLALGRSRLVRTVTASR